MTDSSTSKALADIAQGRRELEAIATNARRNAKSLTRQAAEATAQAERFESLAKFALPIGLKETDIQAHYWVQVNGVWQHDLDGYAFDWEQERPLPFAFCSCPTCRSFK